MAHIDTHMPPASHSSSSSPARHTHNLSPDEKPEEFSPLKDLLRTETIYVDLLTGIVRKVAAAWSRTNLPPPELDAMFRSVESVYKANRAFTTKLKAIGANPSSPRALGDLLIRWIDDLDTPYTSYCTKFCPGFDEWDPVSSNSKLGGILRDFSQSHPPHLASGRFLNLNDHEVWSLDTLFLLPMSRLHYYKELYGRLLEGTTPGRSDHRLLSSALDKMDRLLATLDEKARLGGLSSSKVLAVNERDRAGGEGPLAERTNEIMDHQLSDKLDRLKLELDRPAAQENDAARGRDRKASPAPVIREQTRKPPSSVSELESRLSTENILDLFTMEPRQLRLQMNPPSLTYTREVKLSVDVFIRFTPRSTGVETTHPQGHVYVLSDLFLICEKMTPGEVTPGDNHDIRLCYPPLAGKVLRVSEVSGQDNVLQVLIMRQETLILEVASKQIRNKIMKEIKACTEFAKSVSSTPKGAIPPLPSLPSLPPIIPTSFDLEDSLNLQETPKQIEEPKGVNEVKEVKAAFQYPARGISLERVSSPPGRQSSHSQNSVQRTSTPSIHRTSSTPSFQRQSQDDFQQMQHPPMPQRPPFQNQDTFHNQDFSYNQDTRNYPPQPHMHPDHQPFILPSPSQQGPPYHPQQGPPYHPQQGPPYHPQQGPPQQGPPYQIHQGQSYSTPHMRPPSEPSSFPRAVRKSSSSRSLASQEYMARAYEPPPPSTMPSTPSTMMRSHPQRTASRGYMGESPGSRPVLPSMQMPGSRTNSYASGSFRQAPDSPVEEMPSSIGLGPSSICEQMSCKVFIQQNHSQWKPLGVANLKLYRQNSSNVKQLVAETDNKERAVIISTIVLVDGVERVGKTGVAIELSDARGMRTGTIYMIQLRNEATAVRLFGSLLAGSDRSRTH
ncbi:hypothetical protein SERLADRAFT_434913 [Serpula lacrymans var. lacrymans S7.9]|uniref:DH domain-containing protein n=1 Tax=Serpula lacrymans var. lacrymans (strain S7.9) TaxID=578457 RepID=F8NP60_SERL9|nr:uncharacterized protein SERLADRAFT_434913 [Serpula lacrymans var. lacrymans S7.9]EGO27144.1 hypothetical protein SERLADRAFT_434913 [Serpula lacrymans var. lacrymans S7.9]